MKFATHVLFYNVDKFILKNIENSAPHVDRIYVAYSKRPWSYNKKARKQHINSSSLELLKQSKYYDKLTIIKGDWKYDEEQRNACLDKAKEDGIDILFTHDADEFYFHNDFRNMINEIKKNPDYDYYITPWICFWKTLGYIIQSEKGESIIGYPEVAINLNKKQKFIRARIPSGKNKFMLSALCFHLSYVLNDSECWEKINTWSHSHQFKVKKWYEEKWLKWDLTKEDLHPINPKIFKKVVKFSGELPEVLSSNII